mgnify:FL=1
MSKQSSKRDVSVVFDLHRVLRKRSPRAMLFSIFAVALLLIGPLSLVIAGIGESSADGGYVRNKIIITYYPYEEDEKPTNINGSLNGSPDGSNNYSPISVTYYGDFASTEYNPQYWNKDVNNGGSSALIDTELKKWYPVIGYKEKETLLFNGWVDDGGISYDPGDLITKSVDDLVYEVNLYAKWVRLENHSNKLNEANSWKSGTLYSNILHDCRIELSYINSEIEINGKYTLRDCVIDLGNDINKGWFKINGCVSIKDTTIIDNCIINGTKGSGNHGEGNTGIFANGHKLILGSNVKGVPKEPKGASNSYSEANYAQIFGGSKGNTTVKGGTNLIIHSGTFSNVVSGSQSGTVEGDTKVILKDVTILDTLTAGVDSKVDGSTYIYASAINMPGDSYEEGKLGSNDLPGGETLTELTESTIITGGCNRAEVTGDTHVFIAGTSKIWDVQGAGRGGGSSVNKSNVTIGGKAVVKHIVAGSITDGMDSGGDKQCVKNTNITVKDQSIVCSVFGAGYDTFYKATYASMYNGGSIAVTIDGDCTVGYVYGGGYRGTIGTKDKPIESISININGGKVLNDVFGGGRGGLDKVCHNADGTFNWGSSHNDTTGFSIVYCNKIKISISEGAIVEGNVYGGGESTPYITKYDDMDKVGKPNDEASLIGFEGLTGKDKDISLASVISDNVEINVNGIVHGSVFGAGKGISKKLDENNRHPSAYIFAMKNKESVEKIPWLVKNDNSNVSGTKIKEDSEHFSHDNYASVSSNIKINMGSTLNESTIDEPIVSGSIHGGGAFSKTYGDKTISIEMKGGIVKESIFGGGKGSSGNINAGSVDVKEISIKLTGGNVLKSVYGGGELAQTKTSSGINVIIDGCKVEVASNVFGGGLGSSGDVSTKSKRKVTLVSGKVIGSIFGSSSLGNDETENETENETEKFDSFVVIEGGEVGGSVYGGGFKGKTHGNTGITITGGTILHSVYGGADVGDVNPENHLFNKVLVTGNSTITVSGENTSIGRSIFGSGNSCLVGGQKKVVTISNVTLTSTDSIQNVDELKISDSTIHLSGRSDATTSQASTKYSLNNIGHITLEKNVELGLKSPTNEIGKYTSNGGTLSSPSNKLVLYGGLPLSVLRDQQYGLVSGYTILQTDNGKYGGAFAYGSKESTGTFVILKDGNYVESLTRDYSNPECRCWYIAGNVTYVTTIVADGKPIDPKKVDIPIQNTDSQLVYTGFDKTVPVNDRFNLVKNVENYPDFSMKVYGDKGSVTSNGIQLSNEVASIGSSYDDYAKYVMSVPDKLPSATIELTSSTNLTYTGLVATITIHLKEMRVDNGTYHVVNSIDIIVNIHTEATSFPMDDPYDVVISTRNGKGETEFIIKRSYQGYTASIESIEGAGSFSKITMESHLNKEGTLGWATPLSGKMPMSTISAGMFIGELTGSFSATIKFTSNYDAADGIPLSVAEVKIKLSNGNDADTKYVMLKISVREVRPYSVTFVNMDEGLKNEVRTFISVYDGETILESQKPHTWDHFVDWYSDDGRNNLFDFTSPIRGNTIIYSSYKYAVHFDDGFGSGWTTYVEIKTDGTTIKKPGDPKRDSYTFNGWVKANGDSAFGADDEFETINSDTTFYAKWTGDPVNVILYVEDVENPIYQGTIEYGKTYSTLSNLKYIVNDEYIEGEGIDKVSDIVRGLYPGKKFVRWVYKGDGNVGTGVYGDTVAVSHKEHKLYAQLTDDAIEVNFLGKEPYDYKINENDDTDGKIYWYGPWQDHIKIQAPTKMIVFGNDGKYTFKAGNASFTGYKLKEWGIKLNDDQEELIKFNITMSVELYNVDDATITYEIVDNVLRIRTKLTNETKINIYPIWEHIEYKFKIEAPHGGSIIATKKTGGDNVNVVDGTKLNYGDIVEVEYRKGGNYTFSRWGQNGSSTFNSTTDIKTELMIKSDTTVFVVLGGLYNATVKLSVNKGADNGRELQLKSINSMDVVYALSVKGSNEGDEHTEYVHSQVKSGTYFVQIKCSNGSWLNISEYTITGPNSSCNIELFTITVVNGKEGVVCPEFSISGKEITVETREEYEVKLDPDNIVPSNLEINGGGPYNFKMPSEQVKLSFTASVKKYTLTFDINGGRYPEGTVLEKEVSYLVQKYETKDIEDVIGKENHKFAYWEVYVGETYEDDVVNGSVIKIRKDQRLVAFWIEDEKATYTVNIHLMDYNGNYSGIISETIIGTGYIGKVVEYTPEKKQGFITPEKVSGIVEENGSLKFDIWYERQNYNVTYTVHYPDSFYFDELNAFTIGTVYYEKPINELEFTIYSGFIKENVRIGSVNGDVITAMPLQDDFTTEVSIHVTVSYVIYSISYDFGEGNIGEGSVIRPEYVISKTSIPLPVANRDGYKFMGWSEIDGEISYEIPAYHIGHLELKAEYLKLPAITVSAAPVGKILINGSEVSNSQTPVEFDSEIILRYDSDPEKIFQWIINGKLVIPSESDGSHKIKVNSDITVAVYLKLRDTSITPAPSPLKKVVLAYDGSNTVIIGSNQIDEFEIGLSKYGFENGSLRYKGGKVQIVGLEGVTGTLFIKESLENCDVEIVLHIISNFFDSDLRGTPTITINNGRSNVLDHQTFSDYVLPSEGGEVIE